MQMVPTAVSVALTGVLIAIAPPARATWSIVIADYETKEVAVGTVTCLTNFDLCAIVPVVVVGKGAAAVQASGDFDGIRRPIIFNELMNGTDPADILDLLAQVGGHQSRQYGIADTQGRMITFTGSQTFQWAGGVIGTDGTFVYAIQGNILAGDCVVPAIEDAILSTPGDMAEKLMAGMEAAQVTGGDGRCSCSQQNPTSCGCPPANFEKSGHIGCMVVARIGDADDPVCNSSGCADGDYFLRINVPFQNANNPDPVFQLRDLFDQWRADNIGRPDGLQSVVSFDQPFLQADGTDTATMTIELRDWQEDPITVPIQSITVEHAGNSAGSSSIGNVVNQGGGVYTVELTAGVDVGTDRFRITVDDGVRPVVIMPEPAIALTNIISFNVTTGMRTAGGIAQLSASDNDAFQTRSGFGASLVDLHIMEMEIEAQTFNLPPTTIDLTAETRVDHPSGILTLSLFNFPANRFDLLGQFPVSDEDTIAEVNGINASDYITPATKRMILQVKHAVFVPFLAFQFDSEIDWVELDVQ